MLSRKLTLAVLAALPAAACSTQTPLTKTSALAAFKLIPNSSRAPCDMQKAVAEHNSVYTTLKTGAETVYKAPCQVTKPVPVPLPDTAKTS